MRPAALVLLFLSAPLAAQNWDPAAGRRLYLDHCAKCHGAQGKGDGPAANNLEPRPRDLLSGIYKVRTTPAGNLPSSEDVERTLSRGMPASAMPSFAAILTAKEMRDVAGYLLSLPADREFRTAPSVSIGKPEPPTPASVLKGEVLYKKLECAECHGVAGRGDGRSATLLTGESGRPTRPADLTAPWTFKGGGEAADVVMRLTAGLDGTPMPSYQDQTSPADRWHLANFVVSLRRKPAWEMDEAELARWEEALGRDKAARGRTLVRSMACGMCHTTFRAEDGASHADRELAGGVKIVGYPLGVFFSRNLTGDPKTGLGGWSEADIVRALKTGTRKDGRRIAFAGMPWAFTAALPDADLAAIAAYLKTLPPVANQVPETVRFPYIETIGYKLAHLVLKQPATLELWPGNAGLLLDKGQFTDFSPFRPEDIPAKSRRMAYYCFIGSVLVLILAFGYFLQLAFGLDRRWKQALALGAALAVLAGGAGGMVALFVLPPLDLLAPDTVVAAVLKYAPQPQPKDPRLAAFARRGRMLVNANCMMCHTPAPLLTPPDPRLALAGGSKIASPLFGTRYCRNLTPDRETGLGDWSEEEILRALRSGVAKDGRHLHWTAMPWDRFSNMSEEDLRAVAVYLKSIPGVRHKLPDPDPAPPRGPPAVSVSYGDSGKLLQ